MNLREIAAKKLTEELLGACEEEYRAMYHNGSLVGNWPDIDREEEWQCFWDYLVREVGDMITNLQDEIKETWGLKFKIYQFGHGATFAPDGFSQDNHGHFNRILDTDLIVDWWDYEKRETCLDGDDPMTDWVEAYQTAKAHLAAFKLINERVRQGAATDLAKWWEETKRECEINFEEDEDEEEAA